VYSSELAASRLKHFASELHIKVRDELETRMFLSISDTDAEIYTQGGASFDRDVQLRFPSSAFEIDEAAKCLALDRATACVFHLMRVMEIGIRATARCLGVPDPTRPRERNWGSVIGKIKSDLDARSGNKPTKIWTIEGDKEFFERAYASLDAVRVAWRNTTMHVGNKYTSEEAKHILAAVKGFIICLASRCDENGDPKA
jgi:hypothetical protein